ncbi:hypothetical protein RJZ56_007500 [Blastomyces dermatitidis]|uniref:Uncharacterized protein n=2 Tax=Ajellomyces dermatitidis TaxID=5039 RepID=F2TIJ1_AJEDA|nr:uncharacterized protein BDCG_07677 [Blastomyces dermatitidis ER-3]EEQ92557.2 hypothetical protein BDCG_07677 [Blastomyces dermatitidis ER-3]EGE83054.2 hypothetical protein BDDG_05998 [Blastomyces dermatitidis ATCC 18188]EQL30393.1 hypothetical protein BDFG_07083 [Blastomyces dermatitidis ATCC 26199]
MAPSAPSPSDSSPSEPPKVPDPAKLSATGRSKLRRRMSFLQYRRHNNPKSSPTSESLSEQLRCTSLSEGHSKKRVKSEGNTASTTTTSPNEVGPNRDKNNNHGFPYLLFEPVFRAGILILVTSPSGDVSLGMCDGEGAQNGLSEKGRPLKETKEGP